MKPFRRSPRNWTKSGRGGVSTLDYILVIGIILPLAAFVVPAGRRIIALVYEMITVLIAWPFM